MAKPWETLDYDGESKWYFWFQSACNQMQWMEWDIIDTVLQEKITANIWEMAGEKAEWDKL